MQGPKIENNFLNKRIKRFAGIFLKLFMLRDLDMETLECCCLGRMELIFIFIILLLLLFSKYFMRYFL